MTNEFQQLRGSVDGTRLAVAKLEIMLAPVDGLLTKVNSHDKKIDTHGFIIKLCGIVLVSCVGLIGWGWKEGKSLYSTDTALDRRVLLIEFKLGIPPVAEGGQ